MTPLPLLAALALTALVPALPRRLAARAHARQGAPARSLPQRWGIASGPRPPGRLLWVHAASVGEVTAVRDLARDLAREGGATLLLTTTTEGGRGAAPREAIHQFAPVDTPEAVRRFLDHWRPDLGLFVEGDLWPRLVREAGARGVPLALVNARASRTRARFPRSMGALLTGFAAITTQDDAVALDMVAVGLDPGRVRAVGDLRLSAEPLPAEPDRLAALRLAMGDRPAWAAVSTHPDDEAQVSAAHRLVRRRHPDALLLWAPRHPDPEGLAFTLADLAAHRPTLASRGELPGATAGVHIVDALGRTGEIFRAAPLAFLGGSFGTQGGHNPLEPARLGAAVLSGPNVAHHRAAYALLRAAGGAEVVEDGTILGQRVAGLLADPQALGAMREAARGALDAAGGAREATLRILLPLLAGRRPGA